LIKLSIDKEGKVRKRMAKSVVWYMAMVMFFFGITPRVDAGFSPSEGLTLLQPDRHADLQKIQKVLEIKMVSERLKAMGFTPGEIQARLSQLNDQQIHQMAQKLDDLSVGGDGEVVLIILLVLIIIGLILYMQGHRIIVK
jgi:hypothetical protein